MHNPILNPITNPTYQGFFYKKVTSFEETKNIVLNTAWVQDEIQKLAAKRLLQYQKGSYNPKRANSEITEVRVKREVEKTAEQLLRRIYSTFNMQQLN